MFLRIPKHLVNDILLTSFSCDWGITRTGVTTGKHLTSRALIKNELWLHKRKSPTPGSVVVQFEVFSSDAENKLLMWSLDLFGLLSGSIMEFSASEEISTLGLSFSWIQLTNTLRRVSPAQAGEGTAWGCSSEIL